MTTCSADSKELPVLPDELFEEIQKIFRASPALLVGSGFSCAYKLPGMKALGEYLQDRMPAKLESHAAQKLWTDALDVIKVDLETGLNTIPQGVEGRLEVVSVLRELTASLIIQEIAKAEKSILGDEDPLKHAPVRLLKMLFAGAAQNAESIPVITTNYDTLIELFCDIAELPLETGFTGFRRRKLRQPKIFQAQYRRVWTAEKSAPYQAEYRINKTIRLLKPHGSINWISTNDGPIEVLNLETNGSRAIVVPGPSKYQDALVNVLFDAMRSEMNSVFQNCSSLLCLGFGFNDDHLQGVIKGKLDAGFPMIILTKDSTQSIDQILEKYPHVIAFFQSDSGSECRWRGKRIHSKHSLWSLDSFLKIFLE